MQIVHKEKVITRAERKLRSFLFAHSLLDLKQHSLASRRKNKSRPVPCHQAAKGLDSIAWSKDTATTEIASICQLRISP
jgi:hypothetical protein